MVHNAQFQKLIKDTQENLDEIILEKKKAFGELEINFRGDIIQLIDNSKKDAKEQLDALLNSTEQKLEVEDLCDAAGGNNSYADYRRSSIYRL